MNLNNSSVNCPLDPCSFEGSSDTLWAKPNCSTSDRTSTPDKKGWRDLVREEWGAVGCLLYSARVMYVRAASLTMLG